MVDFGPPVIVENENLVIYQILLDRFAPTPGKPLLVESEHVRDQGPETFWCGGTLKGVLDKLDYIQELGCNAVWLSPWQTNSPDGYHGYFITDLFSVDPRFGTLEDIRDISRECRRRNMQLIGDFVPNHISRHHPYFREAQQSVASQYRKWFFFREQAPGYECFLTCPEIVKLNLDDADCQRYVTDAAKFWLDQGVDVLRLDHCLGPTHSFWRVFVDQLRQHKPSVKLYGEAFFEEYFTEEQTATLRVPNVDKILWWSRFWRKVGLPHGAFNVAMRPYVGLLDGCLDFGFQSIVQDFATSRLPWWLRRAVASFRMFVHELFFPPSFTLLRFADNHDMNRLMFMCGNNQERYLQAMGLLFRCSGRNPVVLYQGDELGLSQAKSFADFGSHGDLLCRTCMRWPTSTLPGAAPIVSEVRKLIAEKVASSAKGRSGRSKAL
eukprot:TRINITY_DN32782_c0_g1_i1.p1 TRINITY_DN32782_c0_g1~~TRINITY_DN32782_c0_g1_i1.p1  ORF type:complete len:437 (+),score=54.48 TRINITY_DN32782_c0_g1_i1:117-1427(+)